MYAGENLKNCLSVRRRSGFQFPNRGGGEILKTCLGLRRVSGFQFSEGWGVKT
jgi:hypothetical protein